MQTPSKTTREVVNKWLTVSSLSLAFHFHHLLTTSQQEMSQPPTMKKAPIDALVNPYAKASRLWTATATPKQAPPTQGMLPSASSFFALTKRASSSISKKKEAPTDSADKAANRQSPLKEYVKTLVKGIPKIDSEGYFYFTKGTGYQSIQNRQRLKGGNLKKILSSIFPSSHIHRVSSPQD